MDIIPDGVIRASDHAIIVEAGEALSENDALYIDPSDSKAYKCDADDLAKIGFVGFAVADTLIANDVYIKPDGHKGGFTGLTPGDVYYLSGTAGEITSTLPTNYKMVAKAVTATTVRIITEPTVRVRTYTADDTWVKPASLLYIKVQAQAAGGGSEGGRNHEAASGAAGGYTEGYIQASDLGATETITIGDFGLGEIASPFAAATPGGDTSFGSHMVADGGGITGANGGGASTPGDFTRNGQDSVAPYGDSGSTSVVIFPPAAMGFMTVSANTIRSTCQECDKVGDTPGGYGYGGPGTGQDSQPSSMNGRNGGPGVMIVTEFY